MINNRIIIFGNSGSGKSTLAKHLSAKFDLPHLDLDTLAWLDTESPERAPLDTSKKHINKFTRQQKSWVIEGCYTDLLEVAINQSNRVIFLNPGTEACISNCKKRPWEAHKYASFEEQNKNLKMLLNWVKDYSTRHDEFSYSSHRSLFDSYTGEKEEYMANHPLI